MRITPCRLTEFPLLENDASAAATAAATWQIVGSLVMAFLVLLE
jgi:hypothetical protein